MIEVNLKFTKPQYELFKKIISECTESVKMQTQQVALVAAEQVLSQTELENVNSFMLEVLIPQGMLLSEIAETLNTAEAEKPRIILAR